MVLLTTFLGHCMALHFMWVPITCDACATILVVRKCTLNPSKLMVKQIHISSYICTCYKIYGAYSRKNGFLPVGYTHEDIDHLFSQMANIYEHYNTAR